MLKVILFFKQTPSQSVKNIILFKSVFSNNNLEARNYCKNLAVYSPEEIVVNSRTFVRVPAVICLFNIFILKAKNDISLKGLKHI